MSTWFYYDSNGQKQGPVTGGQLKGLAKAGMITPGTMVETENGKTALARKVKGLTFIEVGQHKVTLPVESNPFAVTVPPVAQTIPKNVTTVPTPVATGNGGSSWQVTLIGAVLILVVGGIGWAIIDSTSKPAEEMVHEKGGEAVAEQQPKEAAISVSATDLMQAYKDNTIAADQAYKGKILVVKGRINKMGSGTNQPFVLLDTNESFEAVQCVFPRGSETSLSSLRTGQTIRVEGRCDGISMNVFLEDCSIVSAPSETSPSLSNESAENETNRPVQVGQPQANITVTSVNLMQAYEDNQIAADAKYKGKTLVVRGTINKMVSGSQPSVLLDTNNIAWGVQCVFPSESASSLAALRTGQTVFIEGTCNGRRYNASVVLQDCSIVRP